MHSAIGELRFQPPLSSLEHDPQRHSAPSCLPGGQGMYCTSEDWLYLKIMTPQNSRDNNAYDGVDVSTLV